MPGRSLDGLVGCAAGEKLAALSWNRDPRELQTRRRARSAGAQSALGSKPAQQSIYRPALRHLADRITSRLRARSLSGRTVTVRVRFADLRAVTRSITFDTPVSTTTVLAQVAERLVRAVLAQYPREKTISLLAISVSHLTKDERIQLGLPLGSSRVADRAIDTIRERFGREAIGYGSVLLNSSDRVPDEFRQLAERELL
jgi:DNA polymerase-4